MGESCDKYGNQHQLAHALIRDLWEHVCDKAEKAGNEYDPYQALETVEQLVLHFHIVVVELRTAMEDMLASILLVNPETVTAGPLTQQSVAPSQGNGQTDSYTGMYL